MRACIQQIGDARATAISSLPVQRIVEDCSGRTSCLRLAQTEHTDAVRPRSSENWPGSSIYLHREAWPITAHCWLDIIICGMRRGFCALVPFIIIGKTCDISYSLRRKTSY